MRLIVFKPVYPILTQGKREQGTDTPRRNSLTVSQPIIDLEALSEQFDGDKELLEEVAAIFAEDCPGRLNEAKTALAAQDSETLRRSAHSLKGAAGTLAANQVKDTASMLEQAAKNGEFVRAGEILPLLESQLGDLFEYLKTLDGF